MQLAAPFETARGLVPVGVQQQRLTEQAPRERLRASGLRLLGERQGLARVVLDVAGEPVAIEVILADAVVNVEDAGERGSPGPAGG